MVLLPQTSAACQVRVTVCEQAPLVTVPTTVMVTLEPLQASVAAGASKVQPRPHCTALSGGQINAGGVMSTMVTTCAQTLLLPHGSVAVQVRVMTCGHTPLVTVLTTERVTLEPLQASVTVGGSKAQAGPT